MTAFLSWYFLLVLLGWLTFPLVFHLFPALTDRGYTLSRAVGLLVWGYVFWMFGSLGLAQNDLGGILLGLTVLAGLSGWALFTQMQPAEKAAGAQPEASSSMFDWLRSSSRLILTTEILFFLAFGFLALVRAATPELTSAEKPMELAFINGTLRSPAFPPRDPWLSGYAISYYYFGYVMTAMLAKLTAVPGSAAHNLMTALIFGLGAIGSYGILYNLLPLQTKDEGRRTKVVPRPSPSIVRQSLLAPLFLLLVSNAEGLLEVLYRRGVFAPSFWRWLDMREITEPPAPLPGGLLERLSYWWTTESQAGAATWFSSGLEKWFREQFIPARYLWWWRASRVVQDYDLAGNFREVIDEFPFFSFLHADLHPHVLAIPFGLLAIAVALHIYVGGWRGKINVFGAPVHLSATGLLCASLALGGLAFLNTWDILIAAVLIVSSYVLARAREDGWSWGRLWDFFLLAIPLGLAAILLYLPFYLGFSSQAGGLVPNITNPTRGAHLWVMFAPLLLPLLAWLAYLWRGEKAPANWKLGFMLAPGVALFLWLFSWVLALLAPLVAPAEAQSFLASQGIADPTVLFALASARRLAHIGSLITLLAVLIPGMAFLIAVHGPQTTDRPIVGRRSVPRSAASAVSPPSGARPERQRRILAPQAFVLLLIALGTLLILAPEFVYLLDQFGTRLNTVFKFYYQAWILWSLAAAYAVIVLLHNLRGRWDRVFRFVLGLVLIAALVYPVLSLLYKTNYFSPYFGFTLDDFDRVRRENPDEAAAIEWLRSAPDGVVAEAVGDSYTGYARISAYTGLQGVLGWPGHEGQWRGGYAEQGSRRDDMTALYTTSDWSVAESILQKYSIRYIFVGNLERSIPDMQEEQFRLNVRIVFEQGGVVIYEVP